MYCLCVCCPDVVMLCCALVVRCGLFVVVFARSLVFQIIRLVVRSCLVGRSFSCVVVCVCVCACVCVRVRVFVCVCVVFVIVFVFLCLCLCVCVCVWLCVFVCVVVCVLVSVRLCVCLCFRCKCVSQFIYCLSVCLLSCWLAPSCACFALLFSLFSLCWCVFVFALFFFVRVCLQPSCPASSV